MQRGVEGREGRMGEMCLSGVNRKLKILARRKTDLWWSGCVCMCEGSYAMFTPQGSFDLYLPIWSRPLTDRNITTEHFLAAGRLKNKKLAPLKFSHTILISANSCRSTWKHCSFLYLLIQWPILITLLGSLHNNMYHPTMKFKNDFCLTLAVKIVIPP